MLNLKKSSDKNPPRTRLETSGPPALFISLLAGIAVIILVAFIAYLPTLSNEFVWDDDALLTNNDFIKSPDGLYKFWYATEQMDYWPVTYSTLWIEWRLWGMHSTGYHINSLILHIVASLLIWVILKKLSIPGAFLAAIIFAVHPVNVESVAWIAQRKNLMAMLFFLLSILWYLKFLGHARAAKPSVVRYPFPIFSYFVLHPSSFNAWYWLSLFAFVLAMLGKGSVAVLPVLLLGIVWWLRPLTRWDLLRSVPFFVVAAALTGVNIWYQTHGGAAIRTAGIAERALGAGSAVWFYLYKALLPLNLVFIYPSWHIDPGNLRWWLPLTACIVVTAVLWWNRIAWSRPYLFAWGFFCVALAPVMGLTDVYFMKYTLVSDHYQHVAIIGAIALAAAGWSYWRQKNMQPAAIIATALVCVLIFLTREQNRTYRDFETLFRTTIDRNPECWMAQNNLGGILYRTGRPQEAIEHFRQALEYYPDSAEHHNNLGVALNETGAPKEAIEHFVEAERLAPNDPDAHYNHGIALASLGQNQQAIEQYEQALAIKPDYAKAHNNLALLLVKTGRLPDAIEHYEQALKFNPDLVEAYINLTTAYIKTGRLAEAVVTARKGLAIARSQGQAAQVEKIEDWLRANRGKLPGL
jgi:protein O-mannosyl-transferase